MNSLPLAFLATPASERAPFWSVGTVDHSGRLSDRSALWHLGWVAGDPVQVRIRGELIAVERVPSLHAISAQGYLRLPLAVRRRCRLGPGDRLLVAAWKDTGRLAVCPGTTISSMLGEYLDAAFRPGTGS